MALSNQRADREIAKFVADAEGETAIRVAPSGSLRDGFGRLRVSETGQRFDAEFIYDKQPELFDEVTTNGAVTHNATSRDITFSLSDANDGSSAKLSSHPIPYTPGNSQLIDMTGVLDLAAIGDGTAEVFLRSTVTGSTVTTTVEQGAWDNLSADGDIDWTTSHIFAIDFQSLKVGTIRFSIVQNGLTVIVTSIHNDNIRNTGYWQQPTLPIFWELYTAGGVTYMEMGYGNAENAIGFRYYVTANASATMKAICATVKSEGAPSIRDVPGLPRACDMAQTPKTVSTTLIPLLSIRMRSTFNSLDNLGIVIPKEYYVATDEDIRVVVLLNGVLTNDAFANVDTNNSAMEYDTAATAVTGGIVIHSEYAAGSAANKVVSVSNPELGKSVLWNRKDSITGILTVAAIRTGAADASVLAALQWEEIR